MLLKSMVIRLWTTTLKDDFETLKEKKESKSQVPQKSLKSKYLQMYTSWFKNDYICIYILKIGKSQQKY